MQQAKAAGRGASAQSGMAQPSVHSTTGSTLTMSGRPQSEEPTPKIGRRRAKAQSVGKEPSSPQANTPRPNNKRKFAGASGLQPKPKKGASAAASTGMPAEKKTLGKPNRPVGRSTQQSAIAQKAEDAIALLQRDHRTVEQLFKAYESAEAMSAKQDLAVQICLELVIHAHLEEQVFYPACRANGVEDDALDEAQVEHDGAKVMIGDLLEGSPDDPYYDAKVKVLKEYIRHHVNEEEKADGIFSKARQASLDLKELGRELAAMKEELTAEGDAVTAAPLEAPSLQLNNIQTMSEESHMPRQRHYQDQGDYRSSQGRGRSGMRDEEGRFMGSARSSYDDDDNGRARSSRGRQDLERDEQGRFMSDDEDDGRSSRGGRSQSSRGRSDTDRDEQGRFMSDDDDDSRGGRGRSSRGRSDMDRDEQGRFMSDDDDDNRGTQSRGRGRSRSMEDDEGGRSRGRSQGRGWFGDSEGHSQAARQQSQSSNYDEDDRGGRSRGRSQGGPSQGGRSQSNQSQGGRGRSQGHGGGSGDPRGHAQAARRGWRDRD